mgnify:CR=1 FL=1
MIYCAKEDACKQIDSSDETEQTSQEGVVGDESWQQEEEHCEQERAEQQLINGIVTAVHALLEHIVLLALEQHPQ